MYVCMYVYTEPTLLMDVMMNAVSTLMCTFPLAAPSVRLDPPANLGAEATKVRRGYKDCSWDQCDGSNNNFLHV